MEKFVEILTELSSVIGVPAVLCLAWAAFVIRDHEKRIKALDKHIHELEDALAEHIHELEDALAAQADKRADELSKVYDRLNSLSDNVSFIRGLLERMENRK